MTDSLEQKALARYLEGHNLKHTRQREAILETFLGLKGHVTGEELYQQVREKYPQIGFVDA